MLRRPIAAAALAAGLLFGACGDDGTDIAAPSTTGGADLPDESTTTTGGPTTTAPSANPTIELAFSGGAVVGGVQTFEVALGDTVTIVVNSDVADEVHVHGYDVFGDATPEAPALITLEATIPGQFEVEMEGAGVLLAELRVA